MAKRVSREEFEHLCRMIQRWNENRLELFEITLPTYEVGLFTVHIDLRFPYCMVYETSYTVGGFG